MVIRSTRFKHKEIHKQTCVSPDDSTVNQIDHVLIDSRHVGNLLDVRTYRDANIDSDYYLVGSKVRSRISNINQPQCLKEHPRASILKH